MNIAYLILAHNTPKHLRRLVTALSINSSSFFIHIDKKTNADDFLSIKGENTYFVQERVSVFWGDFSQVEAILILLQAALRDQRHFDRFVLLSGADYPLRSALYIERFFENSPNKEFINLVEMPSETAGKPISRLTRYKLRPGDRTIIPIIRKVLMKVGVLPRKRDYKAYLRDLVPYGGDTWWALSPEACNYILTFVKDEVQVVNFFKYTDCPDETLFQTILGNSYFKSRINRNLVYADWSARGSHPAYITERHLAVFQSTSLFASDAVFGSGEMLFARKFSDESESLVAMLENQIREREGLH
jgi:hypothetical protein